MTRLIKNMMPTTERGNLLDKVTTSAVPHSVHLTQHGHGYHPVDWAFENLHGRNDHRVEGKDQ
jgi:hypothetical protein